MTIINYNCDISERVHFFSHFYELFLIMKQCVSTKSFRFFPNCLEEGIVNWSIEIFKLGELASEHLNNIRLYIYILISEIDVHIN